METVGGSAGAEVGEEGVAEKDGMSPQPGAGLCMAVAHAG